MTQRTEIPFFGNHNGMSCGQCVYRMILSYFYPERNWSIKDMNALCDAMDGKYTWSYSPLTKLAEMGLKLKFFSTFDTEKFLNDPEAYLTEKYGINSAKDSIQKSNIDEVLLQAKKYLEISPNNNFMRFNQSHTPALLRKLLDDNYLLVVSLNSQKLNGNDNKASGHFILIHGYEGLNFIAHDPGSNDVTGAPKHQYKDRMIPEELLYSACCPRQAGETKNLIAIKK